MGRREQAQFKEAFAVELERAQAKKMERSTHAQGTSAQNHDHNHDTSSGSNDTSHGHEEIRGEDHDFGDDHEALAEMLDLLRPTQKEASTSKAKTHGGHDTKIPRDWVEIEEYGSTPLYEGCDLSVLAFNMMLLDLQARYRVSNVFMTKLFAILHSRVLPKGNRAPPSRPAARKVLSTFGMDYRMVHACPKDCVLFEEEYADHVACPKCEASRYRTDTQGTKIPQKVRRRLICL